MDKRRRRTLKRKVRRSKTRTGHKIKSYKKNRKIKILGKRRRKTLAKKRRSKRKKTRRRKRRIGGGDKNILGGPRKIMMITVGPTGSGKTDLPKLAINYMKENDYISQEELERFIKDISKNNFLIDDLVEKNEKYIEGVKRILKKKCKDECEEKEETKNCNIDEDFKNCDGNFLKTPNDKLLNDFYEEYDKTRREYDCFFGEGEEKIKMKGCNAVNDKNIAEAIKKGENLVIESTGAYGINWMLRTLKDPNKDKDYNWWGNMIKDNLKKYRIIYVYSFVNLKNLELRVNGRAVKGFNKFKKNSKKGFRLPNVSLEELKKIYPKIERYLRDMVNKCFINGENNKDDCGYLGKSHIIEEGHNLIIFDNNKSKDKKRDVIYDHKKTSLNLDLENSLNLALENSFNTKI